MRIETGTTFRAQVGGSPSAVRGGVEAALREEGFGVLTEIDVAATLKAKLGVDGPPYLILGACNPPLAHRALQLDPSVGVFLPCNVVLRADGDTTIVEAVDPFAAMGGGEDSALGEVAAEARRRLERVIDTVGRAR